MVFFYFGTDPTVWYCSILELIRQYGIVLFLN
jgi:hypothetical protein